MIFEFIKCTVIFIQEEAARHWLYLQIRSDLLNGDLDASGRLLKLPIVSEFVTIWAFLNDPAVAILDFSLRADFQHTIEIHLMERSSSSETEASERKTLVFFLITLGIAKHRPDIFRDLFRAHEQDPSLGESYQGNTSYNIA